MATRSKAGTDSSRMDKLEATLQTLVAAIGEGHFSPPQVEESAPAVARRRDVRAVKEAEAKVERKAKAPTGLLPMGNAGENISAEYDSKSGKLTLVIDLSDGVDGRPSGTGLTTVYASTRGNKPLPVKLGLPWEDMRLGVNLFCPADDS